MYSYQSESKLRQRQFSMTSCGRVGAGAAAAPGLKSGQRDIFLKILARTYLPIMYLL